MYPFRFTATLIGLASALSVAAPALAQMPGGMNHEGHQGMPGMMNMPGMSAPAGSAPAHAGNAHDVGPAGATYDLRFIDGMVQHHKGALLMSEFVFDIGSPGVGAFAKEIWNVQSQEIKAMGQWRKAWYPEAPVYPIAYLPGGDPNSMSGLTRMSSEQIAAMQMLNSTPTKETRVNWFLENMLYHHGAALVMAHDALKKSTNPTIIRISRNIIFSQRLEMLRIRQMLRFNGLDKPAYYQYDPLFSI
jgi:uncharacterized protein (DUF305 family)